jgi:8-oxo-dGTP diphosphatase
VDERRRAAAVIVRDGRVLMVHERSRRFGGGEWWTLPGGGLRPGETAEEALRREVFEDTGLIVGDARYVLEMPYPSGMTSVFAVTVADGEPRLGRDEGFGPEQLGIDWLPVPELPIETSGVPVPPLMVVLPTLDGQADAESVSGVLSDATPGAGEAPTSDATARRRSTTK